MRCKYLGCGGVVGSTRTSTRGRAPPYPRRHFPRRGEAALLRPVGLGHVSRCTSAGQPLRACFRDPLLRISSVGRPGRSWAGGCLVHCRSVSAESRPYHDVRGAGWRKTGTNRDPTVLIRLSLAPLSGRSSYACQSVRTCSGPLGPAGCLRVCIPPRSRYARSAIPYRPTFFLWGALCSLPEVHSLVPIF